MSLLPLGCRDASPQAAPSAPQAREQSAAPATTQATAERSPEERLYSTWFAKDVDAMMGEVNIKLTFREDGPMKLAAWSDIPFAGQVRDKTGSYEVRGDVISSDAIRGGTSVKYSFDGDDLIIQYMDGKPVRFKRHEAAPVVRIRQRLVAASSEHFYCCP